MEGELNNNNANVKTNSDSGKESVTEHSRTFTQDEVDAIIKERLNRERAKFSDYDNLKSEIEEARKKKEEEELAKKSEVERLQALLAKTEQAASSMQEQYKELLLRHSVEAVASKLGFVNPSDAYVFLDMSTLEIKDGEVTGVEQAVEKLAKERAYLLAKRAAPNLDAAEAQGGASREDSKYRENLARRFGLST